MSDEIKGISQLPDWALDMVDSSSFSQNGDECYEALHLAMALLNADRAARAQGGEAVGEVECTENASCYGPQRHSYGINMYKVLPEGTRLYASPGASVPEGWSDNDNMCRALEDMGLQVGWAMADDIEHLITLTPGELRNLLITTPQPADKP